MGMGLKDYDSRTALHVAAAEGEPQMDQFICAPDIDWMSNNNAVPQAKYKAIKKVSITKTSACKGQWRNLKNMKKTSFDQRLDYDNT